MLEEWPSPDVLVLSDRPGCFWLLGLFFVAIGGLFLAGVAGLFTNAEDLSLAARALIALMAAAAVGAGIYLIHRSPGSHARFDAGAGRLALKRYWPFYSSTRTVYLSDVAATYAEKSEDTEGSLVYRPTIRLCCGEEIALSSLWQHDQAGVERVVADVEAYLSRTASRAVR
jgi:hypothetical protein